MKGIGRNVLLFIVTRCRGVLAWVGRVWKMGREDPKRVIHAFKVGLSLTLVSLLYLLDPSFEGIGENVMWAIMTVVVVFEFTVDLFISASTRKLVHEMRSGQLYAKGSTEDWEPCQQDYLHFLLNMLQVDLAASLKLFSLELPFSSLVLQPVMVDDVAKLAHERFYTIAIGCAICLLMSLLVFPNWSGEGLHKSTSSKLEDLAKSIEACVNEYFYGEIETSSDKNSSENIYEGYRAVLDSKSTDETLALHASWEPRHLCQKSPWQQYVKVGAVLRQFGYTVVALHGCLKTEIKTPQSVRVLFKDPCIRLASEVSKVLIELAKSIRNRQHCAQEMLSNNLQEALQDLNTAIKSQPRLFLGSNDMLATAPAEAPVKTSHADGSLSSASTDSSQECKAQRACTEQAKEAERKVLRHQLSKMAITSLEFSEALPFAAFASLLVETVAKLDLVIEEVEELARLARFKEYSIDGVVVVTCETPRVHKLRDHIPAPVTE
ncbi:hypothetical protein Fmac_027292 [Flemingia macrophylla]|uniref:Aluminum-activated malate transporter n=1 Tax=Flemingia macrophylla TaxID=520843 RepID=A0ABD1LHI6_9FABA